MATVRMPSLIVVAGLAVGGAAAAPAAVSAGAISIGIRTAQSLRSGPAPRLAATAA